MVPILLSFEVHTPEMSRDASDVDVVRVDDVAPLICNDLQIQNILALFASLKMA